MCSLGSVLFVFVFYSRMKNAHLVLTKEMVTIMRLRHLLRNDLLFVYKGMRSLPRSDSGLSGAPGVKAEHIHTSTRQRTE